MRHGRRTPPDPAPPGAWPPRPERFPTLLIALAMAAAVAASLMLGDRLLDGAGAPSTVTISNDGHAALVVTPPRLHVGDVYMDVSEVPLRFEVTNTADEVVVITYLETSCDCTQAAIVVDTREGPRFAMRHATPPGTYDWRAVLAPGETVVLMVYYDPQAHGVFTPEEAPAIHGALSRLVRIHSDHSSDPFVDLRIDLNQRH